MTATTRGQGNAGNININTFGHASFDAGAAFTTLEATGQGRGGNVDITTASLSLSNGAQLTASTSGQGEAGDITVRAANTVNLNNSSISTEVADRNAIGQGGDISINTNTLDLNQGQISSSTIGQGDTGSITVQADDGISLTSNSSITSEVRQGATGNSQNIMLGTPELTLQNSQISAAINLATIVNASANAQNSLSAR